MRLARDGGTVIFSEHLPSDVPGAGKLEKRRVSLKTLEAELPAGDESATDIWYRRTNSGRPAW